jgi:ketosteroid isomerase-like protein
MKRTIPLFVLAVMVFAVYVTGTMSKPSSDEETLKNLEIEWAKHSNGTDADMAFQNGVVAPMSTSVDVFGIIRDQSPADLQKLTTDAKAANPNATTSFEIKDIKVRVYGDTAVVTYDSTFTSSGMKDKNLNVTGAQSVSVDTWQKRTGKWKYIAGANVSKQPIPPEVYKSVAGSN